MLEEAVDRHILPNGLTVIIKETQSAPLVSVQAWVKTGSIHEGELLGCGLSHYLEHLLFKGSGRRSARQWIEEVQAIGGSSNAYTTFDRTVYYVDAPAEAWDHALDLVYDLVASARLEADEMEREKSVILREIDMGLDDPDQQLMQGLLQAAYRRHPYRYPVIGFRELFEQVGPDEVRDYYRRRYAPENMVLVVAGDLQAFEVLQAVENSWGKLQRQRLSNPLIPHEPDQLGPRIWGREADIQVFRGAFGWKIPGLTHPDAPALDLLASILGAGDSALLWKEIRDRRRLVHDIDASAWTPQEGRGLFWLNYTTEPKHAMEAREAIEAYLQEVVSVPLPESLLEKARRRVLVSEVNARKTVSGQASRLGMAEVGAGDLGYPREYLGRILTLTPEEVAAAGCRAFSLSGQTYASLSPRGLPGPSRARKKGYTPMAPGFAERTLANGARLLFQEDHRLPKVHLRLAFRGGPLYEPESQRGITQLLSTLMTRDTKRRSADEVAERIESVGGSFSEFSGNNTFGLGVEVLPENLGLALEVLEEALTVPAFKEETFDLERAAQISEIEEMLDDVVSLGRYHMRESFFGSHPFGRDALGTIADLKGLTAEDVRQYYLAMVAGANCALAACGDFSGADLEAIERLAARLTGGPWKERDGSFHGPATTGRAGLRAPRQQAVVFSAFPDAGLLAPDWLAGELLHESLSGMSSRLFHTVREERGMAYFVSSLRIGGLQTGLFSLYAGTHPDQAEAVIDAFSEELERLRAGRWEHGELERCKVRLKARKVTGLQTPGARALQAALNALYGLPVNDWLDYPQRLAEVSPDAVRAFAAERLREDCRLDYVVRP